MESAIISGKSKKDIQLLITIAEKMGINAKFITKDDMEDIVMAKAIKEGETGELIDTTEFLKSIKGSIKAFKKTSACKN
jgi:hypothetical protein